VILLGIDIAEVQSEQDRIRKRSRRRRRRRRRRIWRHGELWEIAHGKFLASRVNIGARTYRRARSAGWDHVRQQP
jgi:hypothetical protein